MNRRSGCVHPCRTLSRDPRPPRWRWQRLAFVSTLLVAILGGTWPGARARAASGDPPLGWTTLLSKSGDVPGTCVATDGHGTIYVAGVTGSIQNGAGRAYVASFDAAGRLRWSVSLGSPSAEAVGIVADALGGVYVTGWTEATGVAATAGAAQHRYAGDMDAFVAALDGSGRRRWSTFLGGSRQDIGLGIATDTQGNVYVTGRTNSPDFPVTPGAGQPHLGGTGQPHPGGIETTNAFVTSYNAAGGRRWSTFLGGSGFDVGQGIATDGEGNVYVTGRTDSPDFPVTPGAAQTTFGPGFVASYATAGQVRWATYLGPQHADDRGEAKRSRSTARATSTSPAARTPPISRSAPVPPRPSIGAPMASQTRSSPPTMRRVARGGPPFSGGSGNSALLKGDSGYAITTSSTPGVAGSIYVAGDVASPDFPVTPGSLPRPALSADSNMFIARYDAGGHLLRTTFLVGAQGEGIAADPDQGVSGSVYVAGAAPPDSDASPGAAIATYQTGGFLARVIVPAAFPAGLGPVGPPPTGAQGIRYFPRTQHTLSLPALAFWTQLGGVPLLGLPLTEPFTLAGRRVQVTERAMLVFGSDGISLAPLGRLLSVAHRSPPLAPIPDSPSRRYFPRTGHTLAGAFLRFWQTQQGSVVLGEPIAEPDQEVNGDGSGRLYTVQWFENGRLEWHPEQADPRFQVELGRVGAEYLRRLGLA